MIETVGRNRNRTDFSGRARQEGQVQFDFGGSSYSSLQFSEAGLGKESGEKV